MKEETPIANRQINFRFPIFLDSQIGNWQSKIVFIHLGLAFGICMGFED